MAYSKQTWDTTSYVNPTRMNHIEDGIANSAVAEKITNINITNSIGGAESSKAVLYATGNVGVLDFTYTCQSASSETLTFGIPTGWMIQRGGITLRDNSNGDLATGWANGSNTISTYKHTGTMTVGHPVWGSALCFKPT